MKAYVVFGYVDAGVYAEVVSEQDYHERGPHAKSFRSLPCVNQVEALVVAKDWCRRNHFELTTVDEVLG